MELQNDIAKLFDSDNVILYDGECIYCQKYVEFVRLRERIGPVIMESIRDHPDLVTKFRDQGIEPNEGMIFIHAGQLYWGANAVNMLARLSDAGGVLNNLQRLIMSNSLASKVLYPFLKAGRAVTLWLRKRSMI